MIQYKFTKFIQCQIYWGYQKYYMLLKESGFILELIWKQMKNLESENLIWQKIYNW